MRSTRQNEEMLKKVLFLVLCVALFKPTVLSAMEEGAVVPISVVAEVISLFLGGVVVCLIAVMFYLESTDGEQPIFPNHEQQHSRTYQTRAEAPPVDEVIDAEFEEVSDGDDFDYPYEDIGRIVGEKRYER